MYCFHKLGLNAIEIECVLLSYFRHISFLSETSEHILQEIPRPFLTAWRSLPDHSEAALIRTLEGHAGPVRDCAVSPNGKWIISASEDQTLKVWDVQTGGVICTLEGYSEADDHCAISPTREWIAATGGLELKVWDAQT